MSMCVLIRTRAVDEHLSSPSKEWEEGGDGGGGSSAGVGRMQNQRIYHLTS